MAKQDVMTVAGLKQLLSAHGNEATDDFQVWLSCDEEGNEFLPLLSNPKLCLAMDPEKKTDYFVSITPIGCFLALQESEDSFFYRGRIFWPRFFYPLSDSSVKWPTDQMFFG